MLDSGRAVLRRQGKARFSVRWTTTRQVFARLHAVTRRRCLGSSPLGPSSTRVGPFSPTSAANWALSDAVFRRGWPRYCAVHRPCRAFARPLLTRGYSVEVAVDVQPAASQLLV